MDMGGFNGCVVVVVVVVVVGTFVVVAEQVMRLEATYAVGDTKDSHRKVQTDVRRTKHVAAIVGGMMMGGGMIFFRRCCRYDLLFLYKLYTDRSCFDM
jgi:ABC-type xylose transport system permease subunit